eukprot:7451537-Pyramimonas_sp.AAC.1
MVVYGISPNGAPLCCDSTMVPPHPQGRLAPTAHFPRRRGRPTHCERPSSANDAGTVNSQPANP